MESWRERGGEPDIGLDLPRWLTELGFEIRALNPIVDVVRPSDFTWQWPRTFMDVGVQRLLDLGRLTHDQAAATRAAFAALERAPNALMLTPVILEIIAVLTSVRA